MSRTGNDKGDPPDGELYRELRLLEEVEFAPQQSQRRLAHTLGIALGVANLLLRNLARKGYIRASRVGWKRWVYNLTPAGMTRKVQLTVAYVDRTLDHYSRVREIVREDLSELTVSSESRVAIYGSTELAELLYLALRDLEIRRIEIFDCQSSERPFLGMPVKGLDSLDPARFAKVVVAHSAQVDVRRQELISVGVVPAQMVTLLGGSTEPEEAADAQAASN